MNKRKRSLGSLVATALSGGGGASDTTAPTCVVTASAADATAAAFTATFTFSEPVTGFDATKITVTNGSAGAVAGTGPYTSVITPTALGTVTVQVEANKVTDAAGNNNTASNTFSILYVVAALWLDFADITTLYQTNDTSTPVTADGQTIGYVADKSGNSRHATQGTLNNRPLYKVNQQNGRSAALYDGSNDALNTPSFALNQPCTYIVVAKCTADYSLAGSHAYAHFDGLAARQQVWISIATPPNAFLAMYAGTITMGTIAETNNAEVKSIIFNGASSKSWIDGVADLVNVNPGANNIDAGLQIGFSNTIPFRGPKFELLAFSGALSDAQREVVEAYLTVKWFP